MSSTGGSSSSAALSCLPKEVTEVGGIYAQLECCKNSAKVVKKSSEPDDAARYYQLGIDEAGRGPVFGPMVYGAAISDIRKSDALGKMGFNDSKQLTEAKRSELFEGIHNEALKDDGVLGFAVHVLTAHEISTKMLRRNKVNLNRISHETAIGLIEHALSEGINVKEVYVDTVGDPERYQNKLSSIFKRRGVDTIVVCKKADAIYPICSAASICAKVIRDRLVEEEISYYPEGEGVATLCRSVKVGSGYPGDAQTVEWLEKVVDPVFLFPRQIRFSWSTIEEIEKKRALEFDWHDDEYLEGNDENRPGDNNSSGRRASQPSLQSMFNAAKRARRKIFTSRGMLIEDDREEL
ncbi:ribonuclease hi large subunit, putative [Perkinsus marinus ATCC 50983]|uniref:Ribonuclease n=1 Tax=Perkinsus marinus (strain ATCC 50983 / TXsc) TaxID=423536 RepID=C5LEE0_PERM5|nr:ribonuclease hi large subunit, putative [Perkinsus marinus ATCC 50983]EER04922.1 ribonuclease hi large subunit, putative [Perkinsus marinus ATCC 50983]|eukprot:XP_002773106.1 ribonuclease hi large subunit, putative [Perkinsus marinus ATCC 50983]